MAWYTHDDPTHAAAERARLDQEVRALLQLPCVWYRHLDGIQYKAVITRVRTLELVDLLVLPDADTAIAPATAGQPIALRNIRLGAANSAWSRDLDPPPKETP